MWFNIHKKLFLFAFALLIFGNAFAETVGTLGVSGNSWFGLIGAGIGLLIIVLGALFFWFSSSFTSK